MSSGSEPLPNTARQAVIVLGMHRSGTSALAGLLTRLGATAPKTLMGTNPHNPRGHWESQAFFEFHERLLDAEGSTWDSWSRLDSFRGTFVPDTGLADELRRLLRQEFGEAPLFVIKDPRICRFVPLWLRLLEAEGIRAAAILTIRSPLEVAASLEARDGISREHALLSWLRHLLDAEFDTRGVRRSIVRYTDVLDRWRWAAEKMATDLALTWPVSPEATQHEAEQFIDRGLRHHRMSLDELGTSTVDRWVRDACGGVDLLLDASPSRIREGQQMLDDVRCALDETAPFARLADQERRRTRAYDAIVRAAAEKDAARANLERRVNDLTAEQANLRQQIAALESTCRSLELAGEALRQREQHLAGELDDARGRLAALLRSGSWRVTAPLRLALRLVRKSQPDAD